MRKYLLFFALLLTSFGYAQELEELWVTAVDHQDGHPIEGVSVLVDGVFIGETGALGKLPLTYETGTNPSVGFYHTGFQARILSLDQIKGQKGRVRLIESILNIDEVVIQANRWQEDYTKTAKEIKILNRKQIDQSFQTNTADLLTLDPSVFVQKSQGGGGSPMIRGFATSRVLLLVDGIRMNNAIFRSGNVHNIIAVDPMSISEIELSMGPSSVLHGSDALGGAIHMNLLSAHYGDSTEILQSLSFNSDFDAATLNRRPSFRINYGAKNWAGMTLITESTYSDIRMGSRVLAHTNPADVAHYIMDCAPMAGPFQDGIRLNETPLVQIGSGYKQRNVTQKYRFRVGPKAELKMGMMMSTTGEISRHDRIIQKRSNGDFKYAKWAYGPQHWGLSYITYEDRTKRKLFDWSRITVSGQYWQESRDTRKFNSMVGRIQEEKVYIGQLNADFSKTYNSRLTIAYGAEFIHNYLNSEGTHYNLQLDSSYAAESRYPTGSTWLSSSLFYQWNYELSDHWSASMGARANYINLHTPIDFRDIMFDEPVEFLAPSANIGVTYYNGVTKWFTSLSSGFRAPNIDDAAKVFDSEPGTVIVPNTDLREERLYNVETGVKHKISDRWAVDGGVYLSYLDNMMARREYTWDGSDRIVYDGILSQVYALQNVDYAWLYGYQFGLRADISNHWRLSANVAKPFGMTSDSLPLRHVAPMNANSRITYRKSNLAIHFEGIYNGAIAPEDLALSEQTKTHMYAVDADGNAYSPSWYTLNIQGTWTVHKNARLSFGVLNLMDVQYRTYSSGIVAPGRSVTLGLKATI